jgi:DtxR family manganese transport transcriptional regulator
MKEGWKMESSAKPVVSVSDATVDRYLAAILLLSRRAPSVRSVDVAAFLGCSKACVSVALKQMLHEALVIRKGRGPVALSEAGKRRAIPYLERFEYFYGILAGLGVDCESAKNEGFAMATALSTHSFDILKMRLGNGLTR